MPIEIRELNIKTFINDAPQAGVNTGSGGDSRSESREEIISSCVEQVLQILKDKEER